MKKTILLLLWIQLGFAQKVDHNEKLSSFCKVWGFLKYYHPEMSSGTRNCDEEFFKVLKQVEQAETKHELSLVFVSWIDGLGKIKENNQKDNKVYFEKNFNLSWIENKSYFEDELIDRLKYIRDNRYDNLNYYVKQDKNGYLSFTNEKIYQYDVAKDKNLRLLSLFRYWNMVEYFYPYKYLTETKWDAVLVDFISKYQTVDTKNDYELLVRELVASLDDTHAFLKIDETVKKRVPFKISDIEGKAVVSKIDNDSLAHISNIQLGDIILEVNNNPINKSFEEYNKYVPASTISSKKLLTYAYIVNDSKNDSIKLKINRNDKIIEEKICLYKLEEVFRPKPNNKAWRLIDANTGFINFGLLKENDVSKMLNELFNCKYLIFDLRNYPNYHTYLFAKLFDNRKIFCNSINASLKYPGKFLTTQNLMGIKNSNNFQGKIILLVNQLTISRSEYMAMVFQSHDNVTVIGSQTAGTNGDVVNFNFLEGYSTGFTGIGIFYPDGTVMQRKGLHIDVPVPITINGLKNNKDEILEKALEYIKTN
ncbi:S41 family peptidase [Flavobacterium sp.]|jgi:carboxyl-terminal processing protease|uniref:S41 family peptidase n=1 Tax=Flavobacterium sp. TaxID=239 RepID=UPI0037BF3064